jgi:hypothetical protein
MVGGRPWVKVLDGFVREGNETGLLKMLKLLRLQPSGMQAYLYLHPVEFYCSRNDVKNAQIWFERAIEDGKVNVLSVYVAILEACLRTGQLEWGGELVQKLLKDENAEMDKKAWDVVLRFSARLGGTVDELNQLLDLMKSRGGAEPDLITINNLISTSIAQGNHDAVDKFLAILSERGLQPDHSTLELKLQNLINRRDFVGAMTVFEDLKYTQDVPAGYTGTVPQELLRAMAESYPNCDPRKLSAIYVDLMEMKVLLTPATLLSLADVYLQEEAFEDVKDLLNKHVGHFSPKERKSVIHLLVNHGQRETTSVEALWNTYLQLVRSFPETPINSRAKFMNFFFEQNRPFAAVRILEHMSASEDQKPTKYQYTAAFVGIGNSRNLQCLQKVHQMLNMDAYVEVDTVLRNALMYAYAYCGLLERAFDVYEEIARTAEGPDHATISQVFDICGRLTHGGLLRARGLWAAYKRMGIDLTENNVASYVEAVSRHGAWDHAWDVVKNMEQDLGFPPGQRVYVSPAIHRFSMQFH